MRDRPTFFSTTTIRLSAAFRKFLVEACLFSTRVVFEDLLLGVVWQRLVRVYIGFVRTWNRRYQALIDERIVRIRSGRIRHWNWLKIHLWRAWPCSGVRYRFAAGFVVSGFAHHLVPFQLEGEPAGVGNVPHAEAF